MGVFVLKSKKSNFRVVLETWNPRKTVTVKTENYPTYNISLHMTYEQAVSAAKEYNLKDNLTKKNESKKTEEMQRNKQLNEFALPKYLVEAFLSDLKHEYSHNQDRLETLLQHWNSAQKMIYILKIDYSQFFESRFKIFTYYEEQLWSPDYIKRITKICNQWGTYCARKKGTYFEPIPKIGIRIQQIIKKRDQKSNIRQAATPLKWDELNNLKSSFHSAGLAAHWNWLFIGLFFGLRPSEIDSLFDSKNYRIEYDPTNKINVLYVYQNKLKNMAEKKRWKVIPVFESEQIQALDLIKSKEFKRPLNKTLKRLFESKGIDTYSPRKGFTDLMLSRNYQLEDISTFLGHCSIDTTWRHYKDKLTFKLPPKAG